MFAVVDCNNFFVSCERVFRPDLEGKPVMVLSNNDGCVVARSQEVKALGIPMGIPLFKCRDLVNKHQINFFSANFEFYSDMSMRVMRILSRFSERMEVYSIDEAFLSLSFPRRGKDNLAFGFMIKDTIKKWTGVPVSVGIAQTKTLAKVAAELAKKWEFFDGVLDLSKHPRIDELLNLLSVGDVWGIGRGLSARLQKKEIKTAWQLRNLDDLWIRKNLGAVGLRTVWELRGKVCFSLQEFVKPQKSIICSRSFGRSVTSLTELREAVAWYISQAAEKLRHQRLVAGTVGVWVEEKVKDMGDSKYYRNPRFGTMKLAVPTSFTPDLIKMAWEILDKLYQPGEEYRKSGVTMVDLTSARIEQLELGNYESEDTNRKQQLLQAVDNLNMNEAVNPVKYAAVGLQREWKSRSGHRSFRRTTRWGEVYWVG